VNKTATYGFHNEQVALKIGGMLTWKDDIRFSYAFENFFHPYLGELIAQLNQKSLAGLLDPDYQKSLTEAFFTSAYSERPPSEVMAITDFPKDIDLTDGGPYANYNWELLFHIPLTIAVHLSKNQRFAEAQRWFHYIFDPTCNDTSIAPPQRFWKFLRFRHPAAPERIDDLLALLSTPDGELTDDERRVRTSVLNGYDAIINNPFHPHKVARTRTLAYQYSVVMKYLDNLIAWGDSLFMQDTIETINEATQIYVLAANLLGPRPQRVPARGSVRPQTFADLTKAGLDAMGNALVDLENQFPFNANPIPGGAGLGSVQGGPLFGIGRTLYFCIPNNTKLLTYWDTVADRLFKIRHCLNIEGVFRQLALFDPPIDPGMLVKAAAAGIDISSLVSGANQPPSPVRSALLLQKALELCGELRGLGGALLAAIEKGDGEHLAQLRSGHELAIQKLTQDVRFLQWKQAQEATEALLRGRASALERYRYYQKRLGLAPDNTAAPDTFALDRRELTEANFDEAYAALVAEYDRAVPTPEFPALKLAGGASPANQSGAAGAGQLYMNRNEDADLNEHGPKARDLRVAATASDAIFTVLSLLPLFKLDIHFWGIGGSTDIVGGPIFAGVGHIISSSLNTAAGDEDSRGGSALKTAGYERRADDWLLQGKLAARELAQLGRQIISSLIGEQLAHHEYVTAQTQIAHTQEVDTFLREKFSNEELYGWMQGEISRLYYQYYRFAFETARKAERAMKQELMRPELDATDFLRFNYWDGGRKGLLSGEALYLDLKRMELAYHDNNKREFELTRHVSLRQLDPLALLNLKVTGKCEFTIPESLYDRDCPGHYMRRLKTIAVSIPAVVGPYTSINCTLTLLRSATRVSPILKDPDYARQADDDRFVDYVGATQAIVTSGATNDSGMFEPNLRDDRKLPFEFFGAAASFRLELPKDFKPFDYATISDVILHVRYTARAGGERLAAQATKELKDTLTTIGSSGLALLFSLRHDFPNEWAAFASGTGDLTLRLRKNLFPFFVQGDQAFSVDTLDLYAPAGTRLDTTNVAVPQGLNADLNGQPGLFDLTVPAGAVLRRDAADVFLVVRYSL